MKLHKYPESILVRVETSPEDLEGMHIAKGILTARGGMTSHAAVVARGMGKCCVSGAGAVKINYKTRVMTIDGKEFLEGDWISLNGSTGEVYEGKVATIDPDMSGDFGKVMHWAEKVTRMKVRTNADSPKDAKLHANLAHRELGFAAQNTCFLKEKELKPCAK
jgi:pyruvate, orthophosphate dikinase